VIALQTFAEENVRRKEEKKYKQGILQNDEAILKENERKEKENRSTARGAKQHYSLSLTLILTRM
jgi:hypothetical protein